MRLLVVEDAHRLRRYIGRALERAGYAVDLTKDGEEGLRYATIYDYDVIVLDLMLPRMDGLSVLRELRERRNRSLVLILTARDRVEDRVSGLKRGADDYLVKPFALEELEARIQALVRRQYRCESPVIRIGAVTVDTARKTATRNGETLDLRPREYALLEYLALRRGSVVSRAEIEMHLYDERADLGSNAVDAAVCRLRKKLDLSAGRSLIETRRGMGYVLWESVT